MSSSAEAATARISERDAKARAFMNNSAVL
jgi:hypothetical protein